MFSNKILNSIIITVITFLFLTLFYILYKDFIFNKSKDIGNYYQIYYIIISVLIFVYISTLFLSINFKINILLSSITIVLALYFCEIFIFNDYLKSKKKFLKSEKFDTRTKLQVLKDLKKYEAVPTIRAKDLIEKNEKDLLFWPLGGISKRKTVSCNESGEWSIYESDRYGFNNDDTAWNKKIDAILLGDSYTEGACVNPGEDIASNLRKLNFNTINLAYGAHGTLSKFASMREYGDELKDGVVFWMFYEGNNTIGLNFEINQNYFNLKRYLEYENFSQNLKQRQEEIDLSLNNFYKKNLSKELKKNIIKKKNFDFLLIKNTIKLKKTREFFKISYRPVSNKNLDKLISIVVKAKNIANKKNNKFIFVYLPRYTSNIKYTTMFEKEKILERIYEENINVIDIHKKVFQKHEDPLSLFPFRKKNHYTKEAYKLIANELLNELKN